MERAPAEALKDGSFSQSIPSPGPPTVQPVIVVDPGGKLTTSRYPHQNRDGLFPIVGDDGVESTEDGLMVFHRANGANSSGSVIRIGGYFSTDGSRRGGVNAVKGATFANRVYTQLVAFDSINLDRSVAEVHTHATSGGRFVINGGAYNDGRFVLGSEDFWIANGQLRRKSSTPTSASDGVRVASLDFEGSTTWGPGSLADGAGETSANITVTGAALGDHVLVSAPYDTQGIIAYGWISAANPAKIRIQNETGGTIDLASGTWKVKVIKQ